MTQWFAGWIELGLQFLLQAIAVALYYWQISIPLGLLSLGYVVGGFVERRHFASLDEREKLTRAMPVVTHELIEPGPPIAELRLVAGTAVVALDRFKQIIGKVRNLFGGTVMAYESLLDRARREAVLRLKADAVGASEIVDLRIVTSDIATGSVEAVAIGTAVFRAGGAPQPHSLYLPTLHDAAVNLTHRHPLRELAALTARLAVAIAIIYVASGFLVDFAAHQITIAQEQWIWHADAKLHGEDESLPESSDRDWSRYLQHLLDRIPKDGIGEAAAYDFKVVLYDDPDPNAFAVPGGQIWVTTGLLDFAQSENEVVAILGHEIGHFVGRDQLEGLGRSLVSTALSVALFGADSGITEWATNEVNLLDLQFSQRQELAADVWGLRLAVATYGHAGGVVDFDRRVLEQYGESGWDRFISTHPPSSQRVQQIEALIAAESIPVGDTIPLADSYTAFLAGDDGTDSPAPADEPSGAASAGAAGVPR